MKITVTQDTLIIETDDPTTDWEVTAAVIEEWRDARKDTK